MKTLESFVPRLEIYSIDEAFLNMHDLLHMDLLKLGMKIRKNVKHDIGIPVTVGIAPTKTLAKMVNRYAKKKRRDVGVHWAVNDRLIEEMLAFTEVEDIWGIGHQYSLFLRRNGFKTALELRDAPEEWIRKKMTVKGQRLLSELKGIPALECEFEPAAKKNICTSRSFGTLQSKKSEIKEALCNYTATGALKLRQQHSCCKKLHVLYKPILPRLKTDNISAQLLFS
jgi:DNA polymerase V